MLKLKQVFTQVRAVVIQSGIGSAITFYTCLPLPASWVGEFGHVACWLPLIGGLIGGLLGFLDVGLQYLTIPDLTRSAVVVIAWVWLTGGLHLDGAMDTADGLAVMPHETSATEVQQRRLQVMSDSATGAFGAMAAIALLLLKTAALSDLTQFRWLALILAAGWGRWGQQVAIARYPYLKPTGKGAFHKAAIRSLWDVLPGFWLMLGVSAMLAVWGPEPRWISLGAALGGSAIAIFVAAWFNRQLGGHTGDTYGAVVEWVEALVLVLLTVFMQ
jgi:adenosylcobinamide-GDP ribazoletransferase